MTRIALVALCALLLVGGNMVAADKEALELKLVSKKASYAWPYAQSQTEIEKSLQDLKEKQKMGETPIWPAPPVIDHVLRITNTSKEKVTIYTGGDANVVTLTLKGPSVIEANPRYPTTAELRSPNEIVLGLGKSHEILVKWLSDGFRGGARFLYPTAPGEYTLSATYQLSTADGGKGPLLKSDEIKFRIDEPKK